jgi:drug/metabolite transporter (DMT)-like permease
MTALPRRGLVELGVLTFFWGVNWPVMKIALSEMSPWTFRSITAVLGGLGLLAVALARSENLAVPRGQWAQVGIASILNFTAFQLLSSIGVKIMASGVAAILVFTMPLWAVLLSMLFLGERPGARRLAGLGVGLAGLGVLMSSDFQALSSKPEGIPLMLISAVFWAAGTVYLKRVRWRISMMTLTFWMVVVGQVPILLLTWAIEGLALPDASAKAWAATGLSIAFAFVLGYVLWFRIVASLPASVAAVSTLMIPAVGVISAALVLGEWPGWRGIVALALVMASLVLVLEIRAPWRRS